VSLEAEILPPQTADQTRTTLPWEILLEIHQQIDACALVLRNQYPAQSFLKVDRFYGSLVAGLYRCSARLHQRL
jgi:hypothetical protein